MALENQALVPPKRPAWLIPVVLAACLTVLGAGYLAFGRQTYSVLFSDLRAADASAIITQLKKDGVAYRLSQGGATISVPETKRDAAQIAIAGSGLSLNGLDGFELFNNSDMGLTDFAQKIKYQRALSTADQNCAMWRGKSVPVWV
jgi:flagellar M-ring protein FliF